MSGLAKLLNMQGQGFAACLRCHSLGKTVANRVVFLGYERRLPRRHLLRGEENRRPPRQRKHAEIVRDGERAAALGQPINGVNGTCALSLLPYFDLVDSVVFDHPMHNLKGILIN